MTAAYQRLPALGAVVSSLQAGRHVAVAAGLVVFFESPLWVLFASLAGFAVQTVYHVARWMTFRISVDADELRTSHVFIVHTERRIPIASIHDLHFEQSLLQRVAGVVTVRIETAGGSGTEAELSGLLRSQADALKSAIDEARLRSPRGSALAPAPEPEEQVVAALSLRDLILAGATSATIWIVGGALVSAWFFLDDLVPGLEERLEPIFESVAGFVTDANPLVIAAGAALLLVVLFLTAAAVSIVRTCIRFWGFRATWNGSRLLRSCGLFTKRRQVLQATRIQRILVRETLLQKWVGCVSVELGTAALGSREEEDRGRTFTIPILRGRQVQPLLDLLAPGAVSMDGTFEPVSPLASRRYLIRSGFLLAIVSGVIAVSWRLLPAVLVWTAFIRNRSRCGPSGSVVAALRTTVPIGKLVGKLASGCARYSWPHRKPWPALRGRGILGREVLHGASGGKPV